MIFKQIGKFTVRWRYPVVIVWIAIAVIMTMVAPDLSKVTTTNQADLLPDDAPFNRAGVVHAEAFPDSSDDAGILIVVESTGSEGILNRDVDDFAEQTDTATANFINELVEWLESDESPERVTGAISPISASRVADMAVSPDNVVAIIPVNLGEGDIEITETVVNPIREWIDEHQPDSVSTYLTGFEVIASSFVEAAISTVDKTLIVTVVLVIVLLLWIYRSPVSPLIPLAAVTLSYLLTRAFVALLAVNVMDVSSYADILLVVIIYGAGTDYCLFLISRFREEMVGKDEASEATSDTIHYVGETITSSAGTIFVGFISMIFAQFGVFSSSGPALAIGIIISLIAGLTFVPAMLSIMGNRAFWPGKATHREPDKFYVVTSNIVSKYPLRTVIVVVLLMSPLAIYGITAPLGYGILSDLPDDVEAKEGFNVLSESMGPGELSPLTIVLTNRDPETMIEEMTALEAELLSLEGIADVRSLNNPLGQDGDMTQLLRADTQLRLMAEMMDQMMDVPSLDIQSALGAFAGMQSYFDNLATTFPEIADDPNLITLQELFTNALVFANRQDEAQPAFEGLADAFESIENPYVDLRDLIALVPGDESDETVAMFTQLMDQYVSTDGVNYRMTVILSFDPNKAEALDAVLEIRELIEGYKNGGDAVVDGPLALTSDLRATLESDMVLTVGIVSLGIFIVLLVMLRSVIAPLYLILTVILSYTFTMGVTSIVFKTFFGAEDGLGFIIPVFSFVFLVALGVDYSIFLIGRVKEEIASQGIEDGIHEAVVATGPIITSAGIILAGTFAAMMVGDIVTLQQLGFSVAVGVLVDTFVVRTMLVPAITLLLGKWAWFPGGVPGAKDTNQ